MNRQYLPTTRGRAIRVALAVVVAMAAPSLIATAQDSGSATDTHIVGRGAALVIGNGDYLNVPVLQNAENDAQAVARALRQLGFDVFEHANASTRGLPLAIDGFLQAVANHEIALVFYSGHAVQRNSENYLLPVDSEAVATLRNVSSLYGVSKLLSRLAAEGPSRLNIVILDASRSLSTDTRSTPGLAPISAVDNVYLALSASPGMQTLDGRDPNSLNGAYAEALVRHLGTPDVALSAVFQRVRADVERGTQRAQRPREENGLRGRDPILSSSHRKAAAPDGGSQRRIGVTDGRALLDLVLEVAPASERLNTLRDQLAQYSGTISPENFTRVVSELPAGVRTAASQMMLRFLPDTMPAAGVRSVLFSIEDVVSNNKGSRVSALEYLSHDNKLPNTLSAEDYALIAEAVAGSRNRREAIAVLGPRLRHQLTLDELLTITRVTSRSLVDLGPWIGPLTPSDLATLIDSESEPSPSPLAVFSLLGVLGSHVSKAMTLGDLRIILAKCKIEASSGSRLGEQVVIAREIAKRGLFPTGLSSQELDQLSRDFHLPREELTVLSSLAASAGASAGRKLH